LRNTILGGAGKMHTGIGRRQFVRVLGAATVGAMATAAGSGSVRYDRPGSAPTTRMQPPAPYALPALPYAYDALAPFLSETTLRLHHDKHHNGYVNGLNRTLERLAAAREVGDYAAIKALSRDLAFHGSGHVLHTLYWQSMAPGGTALRGRLADAVKRDFSSPDAFLAQFAAACKATEASGWGVVAYEPLGRRVLILQAEKHQNLTVWGVTPLLVCDVWEHAYYVDYRNARSDYVDGFLAVADWASAGQRYVAALANQA